ncbi:VapE domain-containing protein [Leptospira interrogans]
MTASTLKSGQAVSFETVVYYLEQDKIRVRMPVRQSPGYREHVSTVFKENVDLKDTRDGFWRNAKGIILANDIRNIRQALARLGYRLHYDEFSDQQIIESCRFKSRIVNGETEDYEDNDNFQILTDEIVRKVWFEIETEHGFRPNYDLFFKALLDEAAQNRFHPVRDYLEVRQVEYVPKPPSLDEVDDETYDAIMADDDHPHWDALEAWELKIDRNYRVSIDTWLIDYCGAEDTPLNRAIGRLMLIAAVRRIRQPGCKFDQIVVLEGDQGVGKSTLLSTICPLQEWFSDVIELGSSGKETLELTAGKWIIEAAELSGMKKREVEHIKSFASRRVDIGCLKYDRMKSERPRQFIVVGTTNDDQYLQDDTGNRRFWPVAIKRVDLERLRRDVHLLWSEAAYREAQGESIVLPKELWADAAEQQEQRMVDQPWEEQLASVLGDLKGKITQEDTWNIIGVGAERRTVFNAKNLRKAMENLGFKKTRLRIDGVRDFVYVRGDYNTDAQREAAPRIHVWKVSGDLQGQISTKAGHAPEGAEIGQQAQPEMPY